ncbi:Helix-turn-helix domain protein [compost metagenome]
MQRRASRARAFIRSGSPLAAVASEAGYADQSHMTRDFRRRYGLTPAAFAGPR